MLSKTMMLDVFVATVEMKQGGCLSSLLFLIFMDVLITNIRRVKPLYIDYRNLERVNKYKVFKT